MRHLLIIRGPGASGKSSVGKILRDKLEGKTALLCPDLFYWDISGKDENTELVYEALERLTDLYLSQGYNVVLEGILSSKIDGNLRINRFIEIGEKYAANLKLFYYLVSLETVIKRDEKRGSLLGKSKVEEYYRKSMGSRHQKDVEINAEEKTPSEIAELILSKI